MHRDDWDLLSEDPSEIQYAVSDPIFLPSARSFPFLGGCSIFRHSISIPSLFCDLLLLVPLPYLKTALT